MTPYGSATLFMVSDLDRSLAFCKDVLGFTGRSERSTVNREQSS